jgi:ribosome maturation factor RimP|uniref:Ribosome maturation factor RimP n=1 Tax=Caldisericum exile TaxID=693075 RepID=A0A7C4XU97_9BACT
MERIEAIVRKNAERFNMLVIGYSITSDTIEAVVYRREKGITISDLEELTRLIQRDLRQIGMADLYNINLSTPGLDRVLKDRIEVDIFEGREARLTYLDGGKETVLEGILRGNEEDMVKFEVEGEVRRIPFKSILKITLLERMFEKRKGGKK